MAGRTVPNIATLRGICHRDKLQRDQRFWYVASRRISIYLTWLLVHTGITANQVTLLTVALALLGTVLIATPPAWLALCGASAMLAYHLLDKVDGDIARFRRTFSIVGVYLDEVGHALAFGGIFVGVGLHLAWGARTVDQAVLVLAAAGIGGVAMVLARQHKSAGFLLFAQYVLTQPALLPPSETSGAVHPLSREAAHRSRRGEATAGGWRARGLAAAREVVLVAADFITILLLVFLGLVVEQWGRGAAFLTAVLVGEALLQVAVLAALIWINATANIRSECLRLEALVGSRTGRAQDA